MSRLRSALALALAAAVALSVLIPTIGRGAGVPRHYYLSLGDSLANGTQPDRSGTDASTNQGYVDDVGAYLRRSDPGLRLIKLGGGGTSSGLISGAPQNPRYGNTSQLNQALAFIASHPGQVSLITVDIGDNDVEGCLTQAAIDRSCVRRGLAAVRSNLKLIGTKLRAATGANVPVVGIADYDQFWALWLNGERGRQLALRSAAIIGRLNSEIATAWREARVLVADSSPAFATLDRSPMSTARFGVVPRAVGRICRLTWACQDAPIGFDPHANAHGYALIANAVLASLRSQARARI